MGGSLATSRHPGLVPRSTAASGTKLLMRMAIVGATLLLAGTILRTGYADRLARTDPVRAAGVTPGNARLSLGAARALVASGTPADAPEVQALVTRALARDATRPGAIELRALAAADPRHQTRLFALSDAISRRSLATRLWLIQRAVDRGDVAGALDDFDLALRTSSVAPAILFPILAGAASDRALVAPIARVLDRPTEWRGMFLHYAASRPETAPGAARIMLAMQDRAAITVAGNDQALIGTLVARGDYTLARRVAARFGHVTAGALIADADFADTQRRFPFGWHLSDTGAAGAARMTIGGRGVLAWRAVPAGAGTVASQLLMLPPGGYTLAAQTSRPPSDPAAAPGWTITCAGSSAGQIALLRQPAAAGAWARTPFTVPGGCEAQWIAFVLRPSDSPRGQSGAVAEVRIVRR